MCSLAHKRARLSLGPDPLLSAALRRDSPRRNSPLSRLNASDSAESRSPSPLVGTPKRSPREPQPSTSDAHLGLQPHILDTYREMRGINSFYDWQRECLASPAAVKGSSLVISLPTSGGKTLVAEVLMLRHLLAGRDALLVLPYVSIVQEKIASLVPLGLKLGFLVEEYAANKGRIPPLKRRRKSSLYVATIEKANSLQNALIEAGRIKSMGIVVVDEAHMMGDGSGGRGWMLEAGLVKLRAASPATQVVAMSATLGNLPDLQAFLDAQLFTSQFRPVALEEKAKIGPTLFTLHTGTEDVLRFHSNVEASGSQDADGLVGLVAEVIPDASCLVFCATKQNAENVALALAKALPKELKQVRVAEKKELLSALCTELGSGLCTTLRRAIPYGLGYHHSGLTGEERRLIQTAFAEGTLVCLAATSTLAAGVNLPARRVIIRSPVMGRRLLSLGEYRQMAGRAGRAGLDTAGESIVLLPPAHKEAFLAIAKAGLPDCNSSLLQDGAKGLTALILSLASLKMVSSEEDICTLLREKSLLGVQAARLSVDIPSVVAAAVARLRKELLLSETELSASPLGVAATVGPIPAELVGAVVSDLRRRLSSGLVLGSELHLLTVCVPYDGGGLGDGVSIDWGLFYAFFTELGPAELAALALEGVTEPTIAAKMASCRSGKKGSLVVEAGAPRAYVALMLRELWRGRAVVVVAERFGVPRGWLQGLLQSSAAFASALVRFAEKTEELWPYAKLLEDFSRRLHHCAQPELLPLLDIHGVQQARARQLFQAGYQSVAKVAAANPADLVGPIPHLNLAQAKAIVAHAKMVQKEELAAQMEKLEAIVGAECTAAELGRYLGDAIS